MRDSESAYWDSEAKIKLEKSRDNVWKRAAIASRIFSIPWHNARVLEIGAGQAAIAAALKFIYLNNLKYVGTDVSKMYCDYCKERLGMNMIHTDILALPKIDGGFTRVIALDSLEHIRPEDREQGYKNIGNVIAEDATMVINMPLNESYHDPQFDYMFGVNDVARLCELAKMEVVSWETYNINAPSGKAFYGWIVLQKGLG